MFVLLVLALLALVVEWLVYRAIRRQAETDEARPVDAIVVFGAAQYNGTPSPVFKARLDHAFDLEESALAPLVITTGGSGGDTRFTEAGVGEDYLVQKGIDSARIIADTHSETTYESVRAVARLLTERHATSCLAVSDGFHLYRIKKMFADRGITTYGSPDPGSPIEADPVARTVYSLREMLVTTLTYFGYKG